MRIRVNTATGCNHVRIETLVGTVLDVLSIADLLKAPRDGERALLTGLRYAVKDYLATGSAVTVNNIKTFLETREF